MAWAPIDVLLSPIYKSARDKSVPDIHAHPLRSTPPSLCSPFQYPGVPLPKYTPRFCRSPLHAIACGCRRLAVWIADSLPSFNAFAKNNICSSTMSTVVFHGEQSIWMRGNKFTCELWKKLSVLLIYYHEKANNSSNIRTRSVQGRC